MSELRAHIELRESLEHSLGSCLWPRRSADRNGQRDTEEPRSGERRRQLEEVDNNKMRANMRLPRISVLASALLLSLALASLLSSQVNAFPSGAPEQACKDLKPGHGVEAQSESSPFELTQDKATAAASDQIKGKVITYLVGYRCYYSIN